jgi:hypothetical protein
MPCGSWPRETSEPGTPPPRRGASAARAGHLPTAGLPSRRPAPLHPASPARRARSGASAARAAGTRRPPLRCCRSWARSPPWRVVPDRPVSACTAGCACSGDPHDGSRLTPGLSGGAVLGPALLDIGAAAGRGGALQESVQLAGQGALEFPESSSGGEALFAAVLGGVVGGVGVPAGPHHAEPGAGEDPDGVGVVVAAPAGVGIQLGGPG